MGLRGKKQEGVRVETYEFDANIEGLMKATKKGKVELLTPEGAQTFLDSPEGDVLRDIVRRYRSVGGVDIMAEFFEGLAHCEDKTWTETGRKETKMEEALSLLKGGGMVSAPMLLSVLDRMLSIGAEGAQWEDRSKRTVTVPPMSEEDIQALSSLKGKVERELNQIGKLTVDVTYYPPAPAL